MSLDVGSATRIHLSRVWQKRYVGLAPDPRAADLNHPRGGWNVEAWWLLNHNCFGVEAIDEPLPHARLCASLSGCRLMVSERKLNFQPHQIIVSPKAAFFQEMGDLRQRLFLHPECG